MNGVQHSYTCTHTHTLRTHTPHTHTHTHTAHTHTFQTHAHSPVYFAYALFCVQMLMEFVYLAGECTQASCDQMLQLFKVHQTLTRTVQESAGGPAGTKRPSSKLPPAVQTLLQSCMTTTGVKSVLKGLSR